MIPDIEFVERSELGSPFLPTASLVDLPTVLRMVDPYVTVLEPGRGKLANGELRGDAQVHRRRLRVDR